MLKYPRCRNFHRVITTEARLKRCDVAEVNDPESPAPVKSYPKQIKLATWDESSPHCLSRFGQCFVVGAMVQRLARGPFKAEIRVRFPLALPSLIYSRAADTFSGSMTA